MLGGLILLSSLLRMAAGIDCGGVTENVQAVEVILMRIDRLPTPLQFLQNVVWSNTYLGVVSSSI